MAAIAWSFDTLEAYRPCSDPIPIPLRQAQLFLACVAVLSLCVWRQEAMRRGH